MQIQAKIGGILYDRGRKPGSNYPGLESGKKIWKRVQVPGSNYKPLPTNCVSSWQFVIQV